MKIRAFHIPLFLLIIDFILSIPAFSGVVGFRVGSVSFLGVFRFFALALIVFSLSQLSNKLDIFKFKKQFFIPLISLISILIIQVFSVPQGALLGHLTGSTRIVFWFLCYIYLMINLNSRTEKQVVNILLSFFAIIFAISLIQYPILIARSGVSIGSVLAAFSEGGKIKTFGLFGSANEDANCMMTLFPFALLYVESLKSSRKKIFRYTTIISTFLALVFNGTRTAMLLTFPLVLFIYYSKLSVKRVLVFTAIFLLALIFLALTSADFFASLFSSEIEDGGSLGYRVEHAWIPAINYTLEKAPIFGFGARGWEYLNGKIRLFDVINEWGVVQGSAAPHNVYVWSLVTWGLAGLAAYITLIIILLKNSFLMFKTNALRSQYDRDIGKTVFCSIFAYCIWGGISNAHMPVGWITFFMLAVLVASLKMRSISENLCLAINNPYLRINPAFQK